MKRALNVQQSIKPVPRRLMSNAGRRDFRIIPFTTTELCWLYNVSQPTMRKKLAQFSEELGERMGYYYSIWQVLTIFKHLGDPPFRELFKW